MNGARKCVLVVDDEQALCKLLLRAFARKGFDVITAKSGSEALAVAERERPDLIVTELVLPGISGTELLRRIGELDQAPPVVVLTAHGTPEQIREALRLRVSEFLGKPFELDQLVEIACRLLHADAARTAVTGTQ